MSSGRFVEPGDVDVVKRMFSAIGVVHTVTEAQMDGTAPPDVRRVFLIVAQYEISAQGSCGS